MNSKIPNFMKKNWLTIILAILPPIIIWYFLQRESLELTVEILVDVPVVSVKSEYESEIELRYRGEPVNGLRIIELSIENTGTKPLDRQAFDSPLTFSFGSEKVTEPIILGANPTSLQPKLQVTKNSLVELEPLLLNPKDRFTFRTFVVGNETSPVVKVSGRIKGVSDIILYKGSDSKPTWPIVIAIVASILGGILSASSVVRLGMKASRLTIRFPMGVVLELAERLERNPRTAKKAVELAKELDISQHDSKANLLFLRLKIESLLRDIARREDLPQRELIGSIRRLSEQLVRRGIISREIVAAIADISPSLNRELHEVDSYLNDKEFASLQRLSLNVIAELTMAIEKYSR